MRTRTKCYLIAVCISLILLFVSLGQIRPVIVDIDDFLGLTSHLTPLYWIGLVLLLACTVKAYLDKELNNDYVNIIIVLALGLFLFGPRIFAESNVTTAAPYWIGAGYKDAIANQPIDPSSAQALDNYSAWPGHHFITAYILSVTGIEYEPLMKYMPIFWLISTIFLGYAIGKKLKFTSNNCLMVVVLTITSFWSMQNYYSPQMFGWIIYVLLFMLIIASKTTWEDILMITLTYSCLVITHGLTSIAALLGILAISLYLRKNRYTIILFLIFIAWIMNMSPLIIETGITKFWDKLVNLDLLDFVQNPGFTVAQTVSSGIGKIIRGFFFVTYAMIFILGFIFNFKKLHKKDENNIIALCICWAIGVIFLFVMSTGWGWETLERIYLFLIIPFSLLVTIATNLKYKVLSIIMMVAFILLNIPANYHTEAIEQTHDTELNVSKFFAENVHDETYVFEFWWREHQYYIQYFDPEKLYHIHWISVAGDKVSQEEIENILPEAMEDSKYIIYGPRQHLTLMYNLGFDPVIEWINNHQTNKIYSNGYYEIYQK